MYELTNEQRLCFGLPLVEETWEKVTVKPSPYDEFTTVAYLDGSHVRKVILCAENVPADAMYSEFQVDAMLSDDRQMLLPKTSKGKEKLFSSSNLLKYTGIGMSLQYSRRTLSLVNLSSEQTFYRSQYDGVILDGFESFKQWIEKWCKNTGIKEQAEIKKFAESKRIHQKFQEGDFFRFRINRSLYGYGRILIDFNQMRKKNIPFWDMFMGKPLCVAVYHIATERTDVTPTELQDLLTMPSQMIMDNVFHYSECCVIGNLPVKDDEQDYPVHYGNTISMLETGVRYQCGRTYVALDSEKELFNGFRNGGIGWDLELSLPILQRCIDAKSNQPYWDMYYPYAVNHDLRNPKFSKELKQIRQQMGVGQD